MPFNDSRSDVFSNPPELRKFESLPPQVAGRLNVISLAIANLYKLEAKYNDENSSIVPVVNPIIEQIRQDSGFDVNTVRSSLENAYGEAA
jgi:hypothetical protein